VSEVVEVGAGSLRWSAGLAQDSGRRRQQGPLDGTRRSVRIGDRSACLSIWNGIKADVNITARVAAV
jgi:hypothetical protein